MAFIVFRKGQYAGQSAELPEKGILLGRHPECDLSFNDEMMSGHHLRVSLDNGAWHVRDLNSSNGTKVNEIEMQDAVLKAGDVVAAGSMEFEFALQAEVEERIGVPVAEEPQQPAEPAVPVEPVVRVEPAVLAAPVVHAARRTEATSEDLKLVEQMSRRTDAIRREVGKVIVGQIDVLDQIMMCVIAGGHGLLIGLPGLAKTLMVSTLAKVLNMQFKRIQFTPDLMPSDITGTEVLETDKQTQEKNFRFIRGPIFCNMLLADEINRTPPKTQAALLEAMQEHCVTTGNVTHKLDRPFFVLATQNPIEQEGTYPLPEAQLDRFMFNIWVDYPAEDEEERIIDTTTVGSRAEPQIVLNKEEVIQLQDVVRKIPVSSHVVKYAIKLIRATRPGNEGVPDFIKTYVSTGAGPRAGQYLVLGAKARAVMEGRIHVSCGDIRRAAIPVLRHRIFTNFAADSEGLTPMDLVKRLLEAIPEPGAESYVKDSPKSGTVARAVKGAIRGAVEGAAQGAKEDYGRKLRKP